MRLKMAAEQAGFMAMADAGLRGECDTAGDERKERLS